LGKIYLQIPKQGKNNPNLLVLRLYAYQKEKVHFFHFLGKVMAMTDIFMYKVYFQRVSFPIQVFLNKTTHFFGNVNNGYPPKDVTMTS